MTNTMKLLTGYVTLCRDCADRYSDGRKLRPTLHGGPDKAYCQACDVIHESTRLATYHVTKGGRGK